MAYRLVGNVERVTARRARTVNKNASVSTRFVAGNGRSALSTTNTDRTLGASTRQGWRLSVTAAERAAHNSRPTRNTAEFVANPLPMAYVTATRQDAIGTEAVHPKSNVTTVRFEHRVDHLNKGKRAAK